MSKKCTYRYLDRFGNESEAYHINKEKYSEDVSEAMFITESLKLGTNIRTSKKVDSDKKLRTKFDHNDLSNKGYIGAKSVMEQSKTANDDLRIFVKNSMPNGKSAKY